MVAAAAAFNRIGGEQSDENVRQRRQSRVERKELTDVAEFPREAEAEGLRASDDHSLLAVSADPRRGERQIGR